MAKKYGSYSNYIVSKEEQEEALNIISCRLALGEGLLNILGMEDYSKYYAEKIYKGIIPISSNIYYNVVGKKPAPPSFLSINKGTPGFCEICNKKIDRYLKVCRTCYLKYLKN